MPPIRNRDADGGEMRQSRFTDDEIMLALRKVKGGVPAAEMCRTLGITQTTFYRWRSKYDAAALRESRELKVLREENRKLKQIVADLLLENEGLGHTPRRRS
jgi:putative transposase